MAQQFWDKLIKKFYSYAPVRPNPVPGKKKLYRINKYLVPILEKLFDSLRNYENRGELIKVIEHNSWIVPEISRCYFSVYIYQLTDIILELGVSSKSIMSYGESLWKNLLHRSRYFDVSNMLLEKRFSYFRNNIDLEGVQLWAIKSDDFGVALTRDNKYLLRLLLETEAPLRNSNTIYTYDTLQCILNNHNQKAEIFMNMAIEADKNIFDNNFDSLNTYCKIPYIDKYYQRINAQKEILSKYFITDLVNIVMSYIK